MRSTNTGTATPAILGNLGVQTPGGPTATEAEFVVISFWESIDAVKALRGRRLSEGRHPRAGPRVPLEVEPNVLHYDVVREERK
jgi:heme-degrading monooxygenase HmoA